MSKAILKWLAALGTGALAVVVEYFRINTGPGTQIEGSDALISFVVVSLVAKLVAWGTSKLRVRSSPDDYSSPSNGSTR